MKPLVLGLIGLLFHLGSRGVRSFDDSVARDIRSKVSGEHATVTVGAHSEGLFGELWGDLSSVSIRASGFTVDGLPFRTEPEHAQDGTIRRLHLDFENCVLTKLPVQAFEADIPDFRFDFGLALARRRIRLTRSGVGPGRVVVSESGLAAFIRSKFKGIDRLTVRIGEGRAEVAGHGRLGFIVADFAISAAVGVADGDKLVLENASISLDGRPATENFAKAALGLLNPVLDLNRDLKLAGAIEVQTVTLRRGAMEAAVRVRIPDIDPPGRPN